MERRDKILDICKGFIMCFYEFACFLLYNDADV